MGRRRYDVACTLLSSRCTVRRLCNLAAPANYRDVAVTLPRRMTRPVWLTGSEASSPRVLRQLGSRDNKDSSVPPLRSLDSSASDTHDTQPGCSPCPSLYYLASDINPRVCKNLLGDYCRSPPHSNKASLSPSALWPTPGVQGKVRLGKCYA